MATSYIRGHKVYYDHTDNTWRYQDTNDAASHTDGRPCKRCEEPPTIEGHDACLGRMPGVTSACCGHGVYKGYEVLDSSDDGVVAE